MLSKLILPALASILFQNTAVQAAGDIDYLITLSASHPPDLSQTLTRNQWRLVLTNMVRYQRRETFLQESHRQPSLPRMDSIRWTQLGR